MNDQVEKDATLYEANWENMHDLTTASGEAFNLKEECEGKVLLVVNTASECGWTRHYEPLQSLYEELKEKGLMIIAFPCNQFGEQEPGSNEEILEFCQTKYNVTFPVMKKGDVHGDNCQPIYQYLISDHGEGKSWIGWNFHKFLVDRTGNVVGNWEMEDEMEPVTEAILAII